MLFLMPCFTGTVHLNFVLEFVVWLTVLQKRKTYQKRITAYRKSRGLDKHGKKTRVLKIKLSKKMFG